MMTPDQVAEGLCQEASPASTFAYVPCGAPATTVVTSPSGDETYRMCDMCAHHNVNNRGFTEVGPYTNPNGDAQAEAPAATGWPVAATEAAVEVPKYPVVYPGQPDTEEPEAFRARRNAEIQHWLTSKTTLDTAKTDESDWRGRVTGTLFPQPKKGTQRYDLGGGYKVKLQHVLNYTIGNKDAVDDAGAKVSVRAQVEALEDKVAAMGDAHRVLFEGVVTWKPEVSGSAYEKLDPNDAVHLEVRNAIDELLTIKPGSPQLSFEEPKPEA